MAHPIEIRERAVAAVAKGKDRNDVVETFEISLARLKRWLKQKKEQGHLAIGKPPGAPRKLDQASLHYVKQHVKEKADASLAERCQAVVAQGYKAVSRQTMQRGLKRLGISRKKKRIATPNVRKTNAGAGAH